MDTLENIKSKISETKGATRDKYAVCRVGATKLLDAYKSLADAQANATFRRTAKTLSALSSAQREYDITKREYFSLYLLYTDLTDAVSALYDEALSMADDRQNRRLIAEEAKFEDQINRDKDNLTAYLAEVRGLDTDLAEFLKRNSFEYTTPDRIPQDEQLKEDIPVADSKTTAERIAASSAPTPEYREEKKRPSATYYKEVRERPAADGYYRQGAPMYYPPYYYDPYRPIPPERAPEFEIAPVSIDISEIVEDAVNTAMEKFKEALAASISDVSVAAPTSAASSDTVMLEEKIVEEALSVTDKLIAITEKLRTLSESMTELGVSYMNIANRQKDALELEEKINEMQKTLSKEIKGVQVHQKVLMQDQGAINEQQAVLAEHQKSAVETQKLIFESQSGMADMQKAVIDTQNALEESMREVVRTQKEIIGAQQALINSGAKAIEAQRELTAKQSEMSAMQKEAMSKQKQLMRMQRSAFAKDKAKEEKKDSVAECEEPNE